MHDSYQHILSNLIFLWIFGIPFVLNNQRKVIFLFLFGLGVFIGISILILYYIISTFFGEWAISLDPGLGIIGYSGVIMSIGAYTFVDYTHSIKNQLIPIKREFHNYNVIMIAFAILLPLVFFLIFIILDSFAFLALYEGRLYFGLFFDIYNISRSLLGNSGNAFFGHVIGGFLGLIFGLLFKKRT
jgi:membrane associated rhomboid family serine protease